MKHFIIKKDGVLKAEFPAESLDEQEALNAIHHFWGKPERWVLHKDESLAEAYDDADVIEEKTEEVTHSVVASDGTQSELVTSQKWVKLRAEYTVEIEDITAQVAQEAINAESLAYLASTDWMVLRHIRQKALGVPTSLSEESYLDLEQERSAKAALIVR